MAHKDQDHRILLGRIAGAHGIRGDVLIESYAEVPQDIATYGPLQTEDGAQSFEISIVRVTPKGVIARVAGISDRTGAEGLKGRRLYVDRTQLPAPEENEFYRADLVGLRAEDQAGNAIGTILAVQNYGAGDLLEVRLTGSPKSELVPFTETYVPVVDLAGKRVVVVLPAADESKNGEP